MDLKARKLDIIEELIQLEDENLFRKIELLIKNKNPEGKIVPSFSGEQLQDRIRQSENDYKAGRVLLQEELEKRLSEKFG